MFFFFLSVFFLLKRSKIPEWTFSLSFHYSWEMYCLHKNHNFKLLSYLFIVKSAVLFHKRWVKCETLMFCYRGQKCLTCCTSTTVLSCAWRKLQLSNAEELVRRNIFWGRLFMDLSGYIHLKEESMKRWMEASSEEA